MREGKVLTTTSNPAEAPTTKRLTHHHQPSHTHPRHTPKPQHKRLARSPARDRHGVDPFTPSEGSGGDLDRTQPARTPYWQKGASSKEVADDRASEDRASEDRASDHSTSDDWTCRAPRRSERLRPCVTRCHADTRRLRRTPITAPSSRSPLRSGGEPARREVEPVPAPKRGRATRQLPARLHSRVRRYHAQGRGLRDRRDTGTGSSHRHAPGTNGHEMVLHHVLGPLSECWLSHCDDLPHGA